MDPNTAEVEIRSLRNLLAEREAALAERDAKIDTLIASNEHLAHQLALLKRQLFGRKSERLPTPDNQGLLFAEEETGEEKENPGPADEPPARVATPHGRRKPPASLPRRVVGAPAPERCPKCGGELRSIGDAVAHRWDWVPGHFEVLEVHRPKCVCPRCPDQGVLTAPEPISFALPKGTAGNGLLARVLIDKFADNIPLNRQVARFEREGLDLDVSTLCGWVRGGAEFFRPLVEAMHAAMLTRPWLQADATGLPVLDGNAGEAKRGHLWAYSDTEHVVYDFTETKKAKEPAAFLAGFTGVLLVDGASDFNTAALGPGVVRAGCWSHARRYFYDARETSPVLADEALTKIGVLFEVEREIAGAPLEVRARFRRERSAPALDDIHRWLLDHVHKVRPRSPIGQAVQYTLNQWERLVVFVDHPEVPAHNNSSERNLRNPVIGRKNWLFAGSEGGARSAAVLFSIVGSCRLHGIDPWAYMAEVLGRLMDHPRNQLMELVPAAWARSRPPPTS